MKENSTTSLPLEEAINPHLETRLVRCMESFLNGKFPRAVRGPSLEQVGELELVGNEYQCTFQREGEQAAVKVAIDRETSKTRLVE